MAIKPLTHAPLAVLDAGQPRFLVPGTLEAGARYEADAVLEALWRQGNTTMQHINEIICGANEQVLADFPADSVDLTVCSPPYDNLRSYHGYTWSFDATARQLYRVMKPGGVVVWVVADATVDGSESGTSFRQALGFMEIGFNLHDTMIYEKTNYVPLTHNRYEQAWEYMFIFSKGKPKTFNPITIHTTQAGRIRNRANDSWTTDNTSMRQRDQIMVTPEEKIKPNIWAYTVGNNMSTVDNANGQGAIFPEKLAEDHILSWSNPGDIVLDPFVGSGTTPKMAIRHHRQFIGIDISEEYCTLARRRIGAVQPTLFAMDSV